MSLPEKQQTFASKGYAPHQWPAMSKAVRKWHEHTRCRGFTPDEIVRLKAYGLLEAQRAEKKGPFVA